MPAMSEPELEEARRVMALALDKISSCVVGWGDAMPAWAEELWQAVNPLQRALGIPETDPNGNPLHPPDASTHG